MAEPKKGALTFIFLTLLIDVMGIGIVVPIVPTLIQELTGGSTSEASVYGGWLFFAYAIMQFLFAPVIGGLSDQYGRRPVLLASLFGFGIDHLLTALAPTVGWLFLARIIAGITGGSMTTASAYIADVSPPEKRSQNFGLIGAAFGLGFILGPVIGGLVAEFGSRAPFVAAAILSLLNWLYGYFFVPESLSKENRRKFDIKRANPLGSLLQLKKYPVILGLLIPLFLIYVAGQTMPSTWAFFSEERFDWGPKEIGYSLGFVGLMVALVQGLLIRKVIPMIGQRRAVSIGLALYGFGFLLFGFANEGWMMYAFMIPYALGGIAGPALQGIMSSQVPSSDQGELQGGLTSIVSITSIIGPLMMTNVFAYFTDDNPLDLYLPGAAFLLSALLTFMSMGASIFTLRNFKE